MGIQSSHFPLVNLSLVVISAKTGIEETIVSYKWVHKTRPGLYQIVETYGICQFQAVFRNFLFNLRSLCMVTLPPQQGHLFTSIS